MENYFNDTKEVLETTELILRHFVLSCQTALIENEAFFGLMSCDAYEIAENPHKDCDECAGTGLKNDAECDCCDDGQVMQEPLEWWLITEHLHKALTGLGFVTLETDWGYYWGRTTSGQAIEMDNVLQDVARLWHKKQRQNS